MKHLSGEKEDLKQEGIIFLKFFFLFFGFLNLHTAAQGISFTYLGELYTAPEHIFAGSVNYNNDKYPDLFISGKDEKSFILLKGDSLGYSEKIDKFFFYPVSGIEEFNFIEGSGQTYFFISRYSRLCGLSVFTDYGTLILLTYRTLESYPGGIIISDFDYDGKNEAIVYGENFNGISVFSEENYLLTEDKLLEGSVFSYGSWTDFDMDGDYELLLLTGDGRKIVIYSALLPDGLFEEREIYLDFSVNKFFAGHFSSDVYNDILISSNSRIALLEGDTVSTFRKRKNLVYSDFISGLLTADVNNDGYEEAVFQDLTQSSVTIMDVKNDNRVIISTGTEKFSTVSGQLLNYSPEGIISAYDPSGVIKFYRKSLPVQ